MVSIILVTSPLTTNMSLHPPYDVEITFKSMLNLSMAL